jgi:hypothetical protein
MTSTIIITWPHPPRLIMTDSPGGTYSQRSATIGSTAVARRMGTQAAASAIAPRMKAAEAKIDGSAGLV